MNNYAELVKTENVIFFKDGCPFCAASVKLLDALKNSGVIDNYTVVKTDKDIPSEELTEIVRGYGWVPDSFQRNCTKPQIFVKGEYIGGNFEFYKSHWNLDEGMPHLVNPMRF